MQEESRYKIVYSNQIDIFDRKLKNGDIIPAASYPFGVINTSGFRKTIAKLKNHGNVIEVSNFYPVKFIQQENIFYDSGYTPRPYQNNVAKAIDNTKRNNGVVEAPTGAGKTNMIAGIIQAKNLCTLIIVPSTNLAYQTAQRLLNVLNIDSNKIGLCADAHKQFGKEILIATWQSLQNRGTLKTVQDYGYNILIVDEAHKASARVLSSIISSFRSEYKFGFSATVYRTHEHQLQEVYKLLGNKIAKIDIEFLYKNGYLLRPEIELMTTKTTLSIEQGVLYYFINKLERNEKMRWVFTHRLFKDKEFKILAPVGKTIKQVALKPTLKELNLMARIAKKDYLDKLNTDHKDEPSKIFEKQLGLAKTGIDTYTPRLNKIISKAKKFFNKENEQGVLLFNTIEAGNIVAEKLIESGYTNILLINGQTKGNYDIVTDMSNGKIDDFIAISSVQFLGEGNDIPSLGKVFIGSPVYPPFSDAGRLQQIIGRAMRKNEKNPNKKCRIVIADDDTIGWMSEKKNYVTDIINEIVKPSWKINSKKIIFLSGELRSGKDTFVISSKQYLEEKSISIATYTFAAPIKTIASSFLSISLDELETYKNAPTRFSITNNGKFVSIKKNGIVFKELKKTDILKKFIHIANIELHEFLNFTINNSKEMLSALFGTDGSTLNFRELLQKLGFDILRKHCGEDVWIKKMLNNIHSSSSSLIFISDARTPDEVSKVQNVFKDSLVVKIKKNISQNDSINSHPTEQLIKNIKEDVLILNDGTMEQYTDKIHLVLDDYFQLDKKKDINSISDSTNQISEEESLNDLSQYTNSF